MLVRSLTLQMVKGFMFMLVQRYYQLITTKIL